MLWPECDMQLTITAADQALPTPSWKIEFTPRWYNPADDNECQVQRNADFDVETSFFSLKKKKTMYIASDQLLRLLFARQDIIYVTDI